MISSPDINECDATHKAEHQPICNSSADCMNTAGSYVCICKEGFAKQGSSCVGMEWFLAVFLSRNSRPICFLEDKGEGPTWPWFVCLITVQ